jgi:transposase
MLNVEEGVAVVFARLCGLSYQQAQQGFERKFRKPAPTRANIRLLVNKFKRTGSGLDEKRSGRPQTSEDNVGRIEQVIKKSPRASLRRLSNQLDILRTTVWRVLHFELQKRACHLQVCDYFNNSFRNTWIGRAAPKHWAPRPLYLTPLDFFTWCFIKSNVYKAKVPDLHDLRQRIYEAAETLTPSMLRDVFRAPVVRWEQCLEMERRQVDLHLICYITVTPATCLTFINFGEAVL